MVFSFSINISYRKFQQFYQGVVDKVEVNTHQGQTLWIHGRHFRPFLTTAGIQGTFVINLDEKGQFISLERC